MRPWSFETLIMKNLGWVQPNRTLSLLLMGICGWNNHHNHENKACLTYIDWWSRFRPTRNSSATICYPRALILGLQLHFQMALRLYPISQNLLGDIAFFQRYEIQCCTTPGSGTRGSRVKSKNVRDIYGHGVSGSRVRPWTSEWDSIFADIANLLGIGKAKRKELRLETLTGLCDWTHSAPRASTGYRPSKSE